MASPYTNKFLLRVLRDLADELGRTPTYRELLNRRGLPSPSIYHKRFGSWNKALEAAGLEPKRRRRPPAYTDEQLLQALRDLAAKLGRTPVYRELLNHRGLPSPSIYHKRFGSWNAALEAAGLEPKRRRRPPRHFTSDQLLEILRDLADDLDRTPKRRDLAARRDLPAPSAYYGHFKTWAAALKAAGLEARHRHTPAYDDEQLLDILRGLADELNRTPTYRDLATRRDLPAPSAYYGHFGSWNGALEAAGLEPNRRQHSPAQAEGET